MYWSLASAVLAHVLISRNGTDQTVVRIYPSWRIMIWSPDEYTGEMAPIYCRLSEDRVVEVWLEDDGEFAREPPPE